MLGADLGLEAKLLALTLVPMALALGFASVVTWIWGLLQ